VPRSGEKRKRITITSPTRRSAVVHAAARQNAMHGARTQKESGARSAREQWMMRPPISAARRARVFEGVDSEREEADSATLLLASELLPAPRLS